MSSNKNKGSPKKELYFQFKEILSMLFDNNKENLHVNKIVKELDEKYKTQKRTGLRNKPNITNSIEILNKMGLIKKEKEGKQKIIIKLTDLGMDINRLITDLKKYIDSYFEFVSSLNEKLLFVPYYELEYVETNSNQSNLTDRHKNEIEKIRFRLIDKGWKREEMCFYNWIRTNLLVFKNILDTNFLNIALLRYARINVTHQNNNALLSQFLHYLIKNSIDSKIDFTIKNYESEIYGHSYYKKDYPGKIIPKTQGVRADGNSQYFDDIIDVFYNNKITFSLKDQIYEMSLSYLQLLEIPKGIDHTHPIKNEPTHTRKPGIIRLYTLQLAIDEMESTLKNQQNLSSIEKTQIELVIKTMKFFLKVLSDYFKKNSIENDFIF